MCIEGSERRSEGNDERRFHHLWALNLLSSLQHNLRSLNYLDSLLRYFIFLRVWASPALGNLGNHKVRDSYATIWLFQKKNNVQIVWIMCTSDCDIYAVQDLFPCKVAVDKLCPPMCQAPVLRGVGTDTNDKVIASKATIFLESSSQRSKHFLLH